MKLARTLPDAHGAHRTIETGAAFDAVLTVEGLRKRYDSGVEAVRGISFQLGRGEVLGLLGPNGAGKTTTVEILTGFRQRDAGEVHLLGLDPGSRDDLRKLRRRIGIVLQQAGHLRYLSVRETVAMHAAYHAPDARDVDEVLELVGLKDVPDRRVRQLSGGQQRRLDVAVALVGRPEVIFLDEPTTGFDPAARRRMWDVVRDLTREGTSVVLTTHYMEEASELADRVLVLRQGEIVGAGTPEEIARSLRIGTTIRATLPIDTGPHALPIELRGALGPDGRLELRDCEDVTRIVALLCNWALEAGIELTDLDVRAPDLEASYLALTSAPTQHGEDAT